MNNLHNLVKTAGNAANNVAYLQNMWSGWLKFYDAALLTKDKDQIETTQAALLAAYSNLLDGISSAALVGKYIEDNLPPKEASST